MGLIYGILIGWDHASDLMIPTPFAFAIQQLRFVDVDDLSNKLKVVPYFPSDGHTFGVPNGSLHGTTLSTYMQLNMQEG